ncbi:MAG TPA: lysylphosphatidylglycerol synthase transmembrane domain-containing protein [Anaerolineales bacterium]|nr:lysylphosphatidylglycerol synthase transmembrane domain-containing protein [Anaerolineales bacterium]
MRKLIGAIVLLLTIVFVLTRMADIEQVVRTFQRGDARWLALAVLVHAVAVLNTGMMLQAVYRVLGMQEKIGRLTLVSLASSFFTVVTTSGAWGGLAIFIADGRKRGLPGARVAVAAALYYLYDFVSALVLVGLGLLVLFRRNRLGGGEVAAATILAVYAVVLAIWLYLGFRSPERLGSLLEWGGRQINRLLRPIVRKEYIDVSRARQVALDMGAGLSDARRSPEGMLLPIALGLSQKALMVSVLFLVFMAFRQGFSVGTLIAGFGLSYLFTVVTPTPAGIGFVEGLLTLGLNGLGVPLASAAVITLAYRGISLWLVLAYGMLAMRWIGAGPTPSPPAATPDEAATPQANLEQQ